MDHDKLQPNTSLRSSLEHTSPLDTLSDAVIFLDQMATILSANERAGAIVGTDKHALQGQTLWQAAPQLVTMILYQAVMNATRTRATLQVEYRSPITQTWFQVHLFPTSEGLMLFFHEATEPLEDPIRQRQERYLELLENVSEQIALLSPDGLILEINQQPLTDAQVRREEVIGTPFTQFPTWVSTPVAQEQLRAAIAQACKGDAVSFEARIQLQAGEALDLAVTLTPHCNKDQQTEYLICTGRDITERKQAEEELRTLVEAIPQLIWIARPDGYITYNNQRLTDYLAMTLEQVKGDGWLVGIHPDERIRVRNEWQTATRAGTLFETDLRFRDGTSGEYHWFLVRGVPQHNAQGTVLSWIGTCTDIDEQKQAEKRIKASEQNFRVLAETVPHLVWTSQPDGRIDYANQRCLDWVQSDFAYLRDYGWREFIHPDDREHTISWRQHTLETGEFYESTYRLKHGPTGEYRWVLARAQPVRDDADQILKWFGTNTDIDEQKQMEEALRQSQAQVQALMSSNVIGIFICEGDEIIEANETFLRMTGYSQKDLQQRRLNSIQMTAPEYLAITVQANDQLAQHKYMTPYEKDYIGKDGSRLPVLTGGVAIQQDPLQSICFTLDNSARRALEQRKDTFISMAGHELRTPLTALKMQMQLLRRRLERQGQQQAVTTFSKVEAPIRQLERLIGELLDVSKMQAGKLEYIPEPVDLSTLLQEVTETMQQIHTTHTIVLHVTGPLMIMGDRGRLEQVIINLLSNAIKYSPAAKTVEIGLSATYKTATITVRDYGMGIPQEQREKIFERFYRVSGSSPKKEMIPGLGMGLYIVEEIIKHHHGTTRVESALGKGSTFYVTLPLKQDS